MTGSTTPRFGYDVLSVFDVPSNARDFLADVIEFHQAPQETDELFQESLLARAQDWHYLIKCADSIRAARSEHKDSLQAQDVLAYVWCTLSGQDPPPVEEPWEMTDWLIARAKELEVDPEIRPPNTTEQTRNRRQPWLGSKALSRTKPYLTTSHYWSDQPHDRRPDESNKLTKWKPQACLPLASSQARVSAISHAPDDYRPSETLSADKPVGGKDSPPEVVMSDQGLIVKPQSSISPYFIATSASDEANQAIAMARKRPPRGTMPSVPFAPLTSQEFGLIQEKFAHEPFWLLIVVTFLIRTKGTQAIPVFYEVKKRFPSPIDIACEGNTEYLVEMMRHLGLAEHRVGLIKNYARGFLDQPPVAGTYYKVKKYDHRDIDPLDLYQRVDATPAEKDSYLQGLDAWEIGHLTQGKYALDSWRIFCRDELLGRATGWNGENRDPNFQPEWMRVRPDDKELRAYLRWMWMKEGWEWNPETGERVVLREELRNAVNEGRVVYDETGGLKIQNLACSSSPLMLGEEELMAES
ncbi:5-methylcytosine G T mismatch-specific DNA glycosylase [Fusarium beomiforme]|uniref:5-methylcytosine G T mismatch-specific DNA glycosylase n=1 Tax=Fusarium beomiforme TaxID=44412 RepID=A0A9P5ADY6_9HYPO|nr:5-methylcytosine G T mismatch-specific DNA glycosylase [Fusarium beomiforme]